MALHRLSSFTFEVPNVDEVISYYEEFGLTNNGDGSMSTVDGGKQLHVEHGPFRRIASVTVGADDPDDLGRAAASLTRLGIETTLDGGRLTTADPATGTVVHVVPEARISQPAQEAPSYNGPGVWGLVRHFAGSNFFWYLKDPAGTFSEYYSDMDCIVDDSLWNAEAVEGMRGLFRWGPAPSPCFLQPEDLAARMTGAHREP